MVAKPVVLRTFRWDTIKEAKAAFKVILYAYDLDNEITDPVHDAMLRELLEQHQGVREKTGDGVEHFYVARTEQDDGAVRYWNGRGIWIRRVDGTTTDFGYNGVITGPSAKVDAKDAMRHAVNSRRDEYRENRFASDSALTCFLSGEALSELDAQVIYVSPAWEQLTYRFAQSEGGWEQIGVTSGDGAAQIGGRFADPDVLSRWMDFFDAHANLELASASANARRPWPDETAWYPSFSAGAAGLIEDSPPSGTRIGHTRRGSGAKSRQRGGAESVPTISPLTRQTHTKLAHKERDESTLTLVPLS